MDQHGNFRTFIAVLTACLALFSACGRTRDLPDKKAFVITTSFYPVYVMALNVAKDVPDVEVRNLTGQQTGCLHDYQLSTADMKKIYGSSVFIANGAGMESFLEKIIKQVPGLEIIDASKGLELIRDSVTKVPNPHVFVSISGAMGQVGNIATELAKADPKHAGLYQKNGRNYIGQLERLRTRMHTALAPLRGAKIVTFHEAFPYFAREFGLKIAGTIEREPGTEPSGRELQDTIRLIRNDGNILLFAEPQYPSQSARIIAGETGIKVHTLDPAVTGPDDPQAYLNIMNKNLDVMLTAWRNR